MIITSKFLRKHNACKDGINFFEINFPLSLFPNGLDIEKIEVTGDYICCFGWIKELSECKLKYNLKGNLIKKTLSSGLIIEYNNYGDKIKETFPNGTTYKWIYEYDEIGNNIRMINYRFDTFEYNLHGDLIKETTGGGNIIEYQYEYDEQGIKRKKYIHII